MTNEPAFSRPCWNAVCKVPHASALGVARCVERGRTGGAHAAGAAFSAFPDAVEPALSRVEHHVVAGADAELEVTASGALCAHARARQVGAAEVQVGAVD